MNADTLKNQFDAGHRCIRIVTLEETEVIQLAVEVAMSLDVKPFVWSVTHGIWPALIKPAPERGRLDSLSQNPAQSMRWFIGNILAKEEVLLITLDMADQLTDSVNLRAFREVIETMQASENSRSAVLMVDHHDNIPPSIGAASTRYEIAAPDDEEINKLIREALAKVKKRRPVEAKVSSKFLSNLVQNLRGLGRRQIRTIITESVIKDGRLDDDDLPSIQRRKRRILESAGVLEFVEAPTSMDEIGGLAMLKDWLRKREMCFGDASIAPPRGVLILGVQGAGKSLASKAIATAWQRPLMRLDAGSLFNKYIGETERNLRDALHQAEAMAPVVLWIDEIEKGFASASSASNDGGVSRRMFGSLLTWMQEHRSQVFLVATANDIEALPPELLRKGRFDEIFFVDLPTHAVRQIIFKIHLGKRGYDASRFAIKDLAEATEGYSGAEIEQAVINAHIDSKSSNQTMDTALVIKCAKSSPPLSVTMGEKIGWLRQWAQGRCVMAD